MPATAGFHFGSAKIAENLVPTNFFAGFLTERNPLTTPIFADREKCRLMDDFQGKRVMVTGGSDGIGRALVERFLDAGARVATCGRNADKLYQLQVKNSNRPLLTQVVDVRKEEDCRNF